MTPATIHTGDHAILVDENSNVLSAVREHAEGRHCFLLVDEHTEEHCLPLLQKAWGNNPFPEVLRIPSGEVHKTINTSEMVWKALLDGGADRNSLLINLGGGVVGDLGGFVAATFKRGIPFVQIPTTLLSMVDASVGGKTGVDFAGGKNQIGAFRMPALVVVHPPFLRTLPDRELHSGFAEMIKHALLEGEEQWTRIKDLATLVPEELTPLIADSIKVKGKVVREDPEEAGLRKILNLGHTVGHAVESWSLEHEGDPLLHGEAVAIGLLCELTLSKKIGFSEEKFLEVKKLLQRFFPLSRIPEDPDALMSYMEQDKKNRSGRILGVLLEAVGKPVYDQEFTLDDLHKVFREYPALAS